jgi:hypothetical protein
VVEIEIASRIRQNELNVTSDSQMYTSNVDS